MLNLKEKHDKWIRKVAEEDKDYTAVAKIENNWYYLPSRPPRKILSLVLITDEGAGLRLKYAYSADKPEQNPIDTTIVFKNERKMIFDINGEYYSYGLGVPAPAKTIFLYFCTEAMQFMVFGNNESEINITFDLVHKETDAAAGFINSLVELINSPKNEVHYGE